MAKTGLSNYRKVYGLLWRTYGSSWLIRASYFTALISRLCKFVALPIAASQLIAGIAAQDYGRAKLMVLVFAAFSATIGLLSPITKYIALLGENNIYANSMNVYFNFLMKRDIKYFNESMTGFITSATRQYSDNALGLTRKLRDSYMTTFISMVIPIVVISFIDIGLGALVMSLSFVQAAYLIWASHKIAPYRTSTREMYKQVSGYISDAVTNIVAIKSTSQESMISAKVSDKMQAESRIFIKKYTIQAKMIVFREAITVSFFLVLFWVTVGRMSSGSVSVAGAVLVITYAFTIMTAIYDMSDALDEHDDFVDKIIPVFELMTEPNRIADPVSPTKLGRVKGDIELRGVSFAYDEAESGVPVFDKLDLKIPAGQKLGIVGLSGAGKSTLAKLLLRFEDVQSGEITIDCQPLTAVRQAELRKNIAYVPQEPLLFHSSIEENIRLGKLGASQKEVHRAASLAHASLFIGALPAGFASIVGERGVKLSGGQKQRIAIARAVLQDAPIMLLDEATSALDSESEQIIKESFAEILKGRTAIVIAHRLSTLADMDRIVLLHQGRIIEDGTHRTLLKKGGIYAKLWRRQRLHPEGLEARQPL